LENTILVGPLSVDISGFKGKYRLKKCPFFAVIRQDWGIFLFVSPMLAIKNLDHKGQGLLQNLLLRITLFKDGSALVILPEPAKPH